MVFWAQGLNSLLPDRSFPPGMCVSALLHFTVYTTHKGVAGEELLQLMPPNPM